MSERRRSLLILLRRPGPASPPRSWSSRPSRRSSASTSRAASSSSTRAKPTAAAADGRRRTRCSRALDIMRQRVDAFGVAEPELAQLGSNQIEVNLPGVTDAERAASQVGSTAQLFFYDWEANILDENLQDRTRPRSTADQTADHRPLQGGQAGVASASRRIDGNNNAAASAALLRVRQDLASSRSTNGQPFDSRGRGAEPPDAGPAAARAEVLEVPTGILVVRGREADRRRAPPPDRWWVHPGRPGAVGHRHQEPGAELRPAGRQPADRHVQLHEQGPQGVPGHHARDRPARRRQRAARRRTRSTASQHFAIVLDNELVSAPYINYQREPGRHRRLDRRPDLRRLHDPVRPGPGEDPQDRRAADQARADLALAGLRHARRAGARPGPASRASPASSSSRSS